MEASERPQLGLELPSRENASGSVRVVGDRIVVEELTIADEQTARVVRERAEEGTEPAATVRKSIEIGARVLESESAAANVDFVNSQFERHMGGLAEQLANALESGNQELAEQIAATFGADRSDSVQQQLREMLIRFGEHQRTETLKLFTAEGAANPLSDFKTSVNAQVAEASQRNERHAEALREQVAELKAEIARLSERREGEEALAEAEDAGTRKGRTFEDRVDAAIERIAAVRGDASSHTGGEGAEGGGRKGDTLVELGGADGPATGRVVFESKDKKLSKNDAWKELNEAMASRAASFGVLVVAGEERVPSGRETLTEYEGNKMIVAVDREEPDGLALEVAYRLASARVALGREQDLTVDAGAVRDAAAEAVSCLKQAQSIRSTLTGIKTSSDRARATLDEMVDAVELRLKRVETLVEAAEPDEPQALG